MHCTTFVALKRIINLSPKDKWKTFRKRVKVGNKILYSKAIQKIAEPQAKWRDTAIFLFFNCQRQDCSTFLYFVNTLSPAVRVVSWSDKFKHFWLFNYSSWNNPAYTGKTFYATFLCFFPFMLLLCRNMKIKRNLRRTGAARSSKLRPVLYICFYQIVQY